MVGIGDMSGDVFGNGMLLLARTSGWSPPSTTGTSSSTPTRTRRELRRAPAPVRAAALVAGPTTTATLISAGGGVFARTRQVDPASPQARAALGIEDESLTPDRADPGAPHGARGPALERRHRHLREGGDGDATPTPATRPTTRVRVERRASCAAKVVGEGGNLGLTQRGAHRVRAAAAAGSTPTPSTTPPASTAPTTR